MPSPKPDRSAVEAVHEFQGPYGPYVVHESVLQRIWAEQAFLSDSLVDNRGRRVSILRVGDWNRLEGPDFKGAMVSFDGQVLEGDVEVHFSHQDWYAHGHERDGNFGNVVLHVVYYLEEPGRAEAERCDGTGVPWISLLPHLLCSLEEFACEASLISSTGAGLLPDAAHLASRSLKERLAILSEAARARWDLKVRFARLRMDRLGWEKACHAAALEVLGFARNRVPMLRIAEQFSLRAFEEDAHAAESAWESQSGQWKLMGARPANHPRVRLRQYASWVRSLKGWPEEMLRLFCPLLMQMEECTEPQWGTKASRSGNQVSRWRAVLAENVVSNALGGSRLSTLACDAILPLLSAREGVDLFPVWFDWAVGDVPDSCREALRQMEVLDGRIRPMGNGWAQGVLGLRLAQKEGERRAESG